MPSRARLSTTAVSRAALTLALVSFALPGLAQYKVIGTDGKVTYTDREPSASEGRVVPLGRAADAGQIAGVERLQHQYHGEATVPTNRVSQLVLDGICRDM